MTDFDPRTMFLYEKRLSSFGKWIYKNNKSAKCTEQKMAKAGFYLQKNETDSAKCFVCLKTLDGWEQQDDPFDEHKRHAPQCPYVRLAKTDENEFTALELAELVEQMLLSLANEKLQDRKKKLLEMQERMIKELKKTEKSKRT